MIYMALNIAQYNAGDFIVNQNFDFLYFRPKKLDEQKQLTSDLSLLSDNEIEALYEESQYVDGIGWVSKSGIGFKGAEGTEDVYKKMGLDVTLENLGGNQLYDDIKWRIITNASHLDFEVNGMIQLGDHKFRILKIVYAFSTGITPNKFAFIKPKTLEEVNRLSPKLIVLG